MDLKGKKPFSFRRLLHSFKYATNGLFYVIRNEQNMKIHITMSIVVILLAFILKIPAVQWIILLIVIGIVLSLEAMNTAIERTIDLVTEDFHPLAKVAKDAAAASVFIFSIVAAIVGVIIFLPPLLKLFILK